MWGESGRVEKSWISKELGTKYRHFCEAVQCFDDFLSKDPEMEHFVQATQVAKIDQINLVVFSPKLNSLSLHLTRNITYYIEDPYLCVAHPPPSSSISFMGGTTSRTIGNLLARRTTSASGRAISGVGFSLSSGLRVLSVAFLGPTIGFLDDFQNESCVCCGKICPGGF